MRHTIKCTICRETRKVNGQKQISNFGEQHRHHLQQTEYMTGNHLELDEPQDRIALGLDPQPLVTGYDVLQPRRDYWRKIPGGI